MPMGRDSLGLVRAASKSPISLVKTSIPLYPINSWILLEKRKINRQTTNVSNIEMITVAFTGKDGGDIAKIVDYSINVSSSSTARIQQAHITGGHFICEMVDIKLFQKPDFK